jgi:hypothetical protein
MDPARGCSAIRWGAEDEDGGIRIEVEEEDTLESSDSKLGVAMTFHSVFTWSENSKTS